MNTIKVLVIAFLVAFAVAAFALEVEPSDVVLVQVEGKASPKTISCVENKPGQLSTRNGSLIFKSYTQIIRRRSALGDEAGTLKGRRLRKKGKVACAEGSDAVKTPLVTVGSLAEPVIEGLNPVGVIANSIFSAVGAVRLPSSQASLPELVALIENYFSCATVSHSGLSLTVDFGASCIVNGAEFSGSFTGELDLNGKLTITLDGLAVDDKAVAGTIGLSVLSASTAALNGLEVVFDITVSDQFRTVRVTFEGEGSGDQNGVTLDGQGEYDDSSNNIDFTATELHKTFDDGSCYPDSGSVTLDLNGNPDVTVTFSEDTPISNEALVQIGNLDPELQELPEC